ncbi:MAG: metallophosphoesterase [Pseudonocardia sp.]|nr:metallophosphoesterase [Pseudonocardia sp.]
MRVHVVSDVHGNVDALARAAEGCDAMIVLGDLVDFVDYRDPTRGILGRVLGPEVSAEFGRLRSSGRPGELMAFARRAWERIPDPAAVVAEAVREQYAALFAVMPDPTWAIPGNVDLPELWADYSRPGLHMPDGKVVEIGGRRVGFVGGVPLPPGIRPRGGGPWRPHLLAVEDYADAVAGLTEIDLLCSHAPPAVPELAYDVVSRRQEFAAAALLDVIARDRPAMAFFGHVHQPLSKRLRIGRTECVNVGHFREGGRPYVLHL